MMSINSQASRIKPNPLAGKHVLLLAASPGALGGVRGLWHSRQPLDALECHVYPKMVGVPKAHVVLAEEGQIADEQIKSQIDQLVKEFIAYVEVAPN
jgi:chromate reductase, NAD(P)H dehydrogenase (quinone)